MQHPIDPEKLDSLLQRVAGDVGAAFIGALVALGDDLGLYRALAALGAADPPALAARAGVAERHVREWLAAQAAAGYVDYDAATGRFALSPEQALVFAAPDSPVLATGNFQTARGLYAVVDRVAAAFRTGGGVGWGEHDRCVHHGTATAFAAAYRAFLLPEWLPALDGVVARLEQGGAVADVGCGHGRATAMMAGAFPASRFVGYDVHAASIAEARRLAAGLDNLRFEEASFTTFPGHDLDLVTSFDALHDTGDPVGAARRVHAALAPHGRWMLVEPLAHDRLEDNLNPGGRIAYAASTMLCTPGALSQPGGVALGAQAGEARLREVTRAAGFTALRRIATSPMHMVLEATP